MLAEKECSVSGHVEKLQKSYQMRGVDAAMRAICTNHTVSRLTSLCRSFY